jgi:ATP-dependent DNA helicase RecQ
MTRRGTWVRFAALDSIHDILRRHWGYDAFRPLQEDIIATVLDGTDVLALLPTGGGKSVCYQVPALAQEGICLVISPLIALMKDQVENLKRRGILAAAIYTGMSRRAIIQTLKNVAHGPYKLLYVSPERLETGLFREYLPALGVNLIAVDEAHCISQWGYDFRPAYLRIAALRTEIPNVPLLALTASATEDVQRDIAEKLKLTGHRVFRQSFLRPNLSYSAFKPDSKLTRLVEIVKKVPGTGIVYCKSRRRTVEIAELLQMHGIPASAYHAGLSAELRTHRQQDWIGDRARIMVCTNAFGMGIDKPDVRLVVHLDLPDCLESYYQEAGRAGRDGKRSYAVLLYSEADLTALAAAHIKRFPDLEQIRAVYGALVNFLQMPSYTGDETAFPFQFESFVKNFSLDPTITLHALKAIEGDGWLQLQEKSFTPATVVFTTNKNGLDDFQRSYPGHDELLTTLLRTYSGIFDGPVAISEKVLAGLLRFTEADIKKMLGAVHALGIIRYLPVDEAPKIYFQKHRVPVNEFSISMVLFLQRKEAFIRRAAQMIAFAKTEDCRSVFINLYFGDPDETPCGVCDCCLRRKETPLTGDELATVETRIGDVLTEGPLAPAELLNRLTGHSKRKAWQVITFLQGEKKLAVDEKGRFFLP